MRMYNKMFLLFLVILVLGFSQNDYPQSMATRLDSLTHYIENLQDSITKKNIELKWLEKKVKMLNTKSSRVTRKNESWRKLERYMSIEEVEKLLGKPTAIDNSSSSTRYWYENGYIDFNAFKRVSDWSEPRNNRVEVIEH